MNGMRTWLAAGAVILAATLIAAATLEPRDLEDRVWQLQQEVARHAASGDWDAAVTAIREMAALDPHHPKVYIQTVLLLRRQGRLDDAAALMDTLGPPDGPGRAFGEGMVLSMTGRPLDAASRFSLALERYRALDHAAGQAAGLNALGRTAHLAGRLNEAARQYEAALVFLEAIGDQASKAGVLSNLALIESRRGRPKIALEWQLPLLEMQAELGDSARQARTWNSIGVNRSQLGDRDGAIEAFENALELYREGNDLSGQISTLEMTANAHAGFDEWEPAMERFDEAFALAADSSNPAEVAGVRRAVGDTFLSHGRSRDAVGHLRTAAGLYLDLGLDRERAGVLVLLGTALNELGAFRKAQVVLNEALEIARDVDDLSVEASALTDLGNVSLATGEPAQALIHQERALTLHRRIGDRFAERWNLTNLGAIYFSIGNLDRARHYARETLELAEELGDPAAVALAQHNLGAILAEEGEVEAALDQMRRSIETRESRNDRRGAGLGRANVAEVLLRSGRRDEAANEAAKALKAFRESGDLAGEALAMNLRGEILLATGDPDAALAAHRAAEATALEAGVSEQRWRAQAGLAAALGAKGETAAALEEATRAIDGVEAVRSSLVTGELKMRFLARRIDLYELALTLALTSRDNTISPDAVARGFELAERARARSLLDLLAESRAQLRARLDPDLVRREEELLELVGTAAVRVSEARDGNERDQAHRELAEAETRLERFGVEIRREAPGYAELVYPSPATAGEIRTDVLRDEEVLLSYFVGDKRAWLFVLDRRGISVYPLDSPDAIATRVEAFLDAAATPRVDLGGGRAELDAAESLAAAILPSVELTPGTRLIVAPDGPLHHVPFDALRVGNRFLVEDHEVLVVPSPTALGLMREQPWAVAASGFLGVGAPLAREGNEAPPPLPHATRELDELPCPTQLGSWTRSPGSFRRLGDDCWWGLLPRDQRSSRSISEVSGTSTSQHTGGSKRTTRGAAVFGSRPAGRMNRRACSPWTTSSPSASAPRRSCCPPAAPGWASCSGGRDW